MNYQRGFTLVELSIVLVILGLLVGGVLTGQSLIHAAELRSVATQEQSYVTAIQTFRDKYFAIPGDMPNAISFWGSAGGTGADATCFAVVSTDATTCNGDGDGTFNNVNGITQEAWRLWQHLANAGLISGTYSGNGTVPGVGVPGAKISNAYFRAIAWNNAGSGTYFATPGNNTMELMQVGWLPTKVNGGPLKPEDAYNIDMKMDDGVPGTGKVVGFKGSSPNTPCTNMAGVFPPGDAGALYNLSDTSNSCMLFFTNAF